MKPVRRGIAILGLLALAGVAMVGCGDNRSVKQMVADARALSARNQHEKAAGEWSKAIAKIEKEMPHHPDTLNMVQMRAMAWSRAKKYDEAVADYERVIKARPKDPYAYLGLSKVYHEKGDGKNFQEVIQRAKGRGVNLAAVVKDMRARTGR